MRRPLEIYIHIPFCVRKCRYCDFLSFPADEEVKGNYVDALINEIGAFNLAEEYQVDTVFFGGGTPSVLDGVAVLRIMDQIKNHFKTNASVEVSIEANPGTVSAEKFVMYREAGINRLSFGLQSVHDKELEALGRIHTFEMFLESYEMARNQGFANINVDLMSALPGQSCVLWEESLAKVLKLRPEHISAYSLIVEEGTPFYNMWEKNQLDLPCEEVERAMYHRTKEILGQAGYDRYEISNYARKGYECRHNIGYWTGVEYIGFGLGASSLISHQRIKNTMDMENYLAEHLYNKKEVRTEKEVQTPENQIEEYMFLGLRLSKGISASEFQKKFGRNIREIYGTVLEKHRREGLLDMNGDTVRLTEKGMDLSNYVLADFLIEC